jgi:hypothetical protein
MQFSDLAQYWILVEMYDITKTRSGQLIPKTCKKVHRSETSFWVFGYHKAPCTTHHHEPKFLILLPFLAAQKEHHLFLPTIQLYSSWNQYLAPSTCVFCTEITWFPSMHFVESTSLCCNNCCPVQKSSDFRAATLLTSIAGVANNYCLVQKSPNFPEHTLLNPPASNTTFEALYRNYWFPSRHFVEATSACYSDCCFVQKSPDFWAYTLL